MSLFGTSPPASTALFDDGPMIGGLTINRDSTGSVTDNMMRSTTSQPSLFDDAGSDIWALPAPRARSAGPGFAGGGALIGGGGGERRTELVRSLLTSENAEIPEVYIDAYDKVLGIVGGSRGVGIEGVKLVLDEAEELDKGVKRRIEEAIITGHGEDVIVGRGEFNVLLAMIGLAQEGDDISIDSVDDRRRSLPVPRLKTLYHQSRSSPSPFSPSGARYDSTLQTPTTSAASSSNHDQAQLRDGVHIPPPAQQQLQQQPPQPPERTSSASLRAQSQSQPQAQAIPNSVTNTSPVRTRTYGRSMDPNEQDPWSSPEMHTGHNHVPAGNPIMNTNGNHMVGPAQYTSPSRQKPSQQQSYMPPMESHEPDDLQAALAGPTRHPTMGPNWGDPVGGGGFSGVSEPGFDGLTSPGGLGRMGSYGGLGGGSVRGSGPSAPSTTGTGPVRQAGVIVETVTVTVLPEKEGMFMFQHRNYQIASRRRGCKVVRRYSDFVW